MYESLRWLARRNYRERRIASKENYLKLTIKEQDQKVLLVFYDKPPREVRNYIRLYHFRWSRKYRYWHSYLNKNKIENVKKIYRFINQNNNNKNNPYG